MAEKQKRIRPRNPHAKALRTPLFAPKIVPNKMERNKALDELTELSEQMGLYDDLKHGNETPNLPHNFCGICHKEWEDCECYDD